MGRHPPPPVRVLESALYADDLDAAELFYGGILGLERIVRAGERHVFFRCGEGVVLLFNAELTVKPAAEDAPFPVPLHGAVGPGHICFAEPAEALQRRRTALEAAGVRVEADFCWPNGVRSFYVRDPAGNSVEFSEAALWGRPDCSQSG